MTVTERVAFVRGLFEGLDFGENKKEGKILTAIIDLLEDMALTIEDLEDENEALQEVVDALIEDLYEDEDFEDEEDDDETAGIDGDLFQVVCPTCGEDIYVDEATLDMGNIQCPACGEELEFDLSTLDDSVYSEDE